MASEGTMILLASVFMSGVAHGRENPEPNEEADKETSARVALRGAVLMDQVQDIRKFVESQERERD